MTVGRSSSNAEDQALAECAELAGASRATALARGKLIEVTHDDSARVLSRLAQAYQHLGLTEQAIRVSQRVEELRRAANPKAAATGFEADPRQQGGAPPSVPPPSGRSAGSGSRQRAKPSSLPPPPMPPPARGSLPPPPMPPPMRTPSSAPPPMPVAPALQPATSEVEAEPQPEANAVHDLAPVAGKQRHSRRLRRWHLAAAAGVLLAGFCGYSWFMDRHLRSGLADAEQQLSVGTPEALARSQLVLDGDFTLRWPVRITADLIAGLPAGRLPPDVKASILRLEHGVTLRLMGQAYQGNLKDGADQAERLGAPPDRVAFARVQYAMDHEDQQKALSLVQAWDEKTANDAYFQLAAAIVQARAGNDSEALERFDRARKLLPGSLTPLLLAAELVVSEGLDDPQPRLDALEKYDAPVAKISARALRGLRWALEPVASGPRLLSEELRLSTEQQDELPARLRHVPAIIRVKEGLIAGASVGDALKRGLAGAVHANVITTLGRMALTSGKVQAALDALKRLRDVAPNYPELGRFSLDVALSTDDLEQARSIVKGDTTTTAIVEAVNAYEQLDLKSLRAQIPFLKGKQRAEALLVGWGVQTGEKLLGEDLAPTYRDSVWGFAIQVDSALYAGELSRADQLLRDWNEPGSSAYLARKAQLSRYQGDTTAALELARRGRPEQNPRAFREELLALVAAGKATEALEIIKVKERREILGPLEGWMLALVAGKARGRRAALGKIGHLPMPTSTTPIAVRVMAARAMLTAGDSRGKSMLVLLEAVVPKHPELELTREDGEDR